MNKICLNCNKEYNNHSGKYCSVACIDYHLKNRTFSKVCVKCGTTFNSRSGSGKYCSRECNIPKKQVRKYKKELLKREVLLSEKNELLRDVKYFLTKLKYNNYYADIIDIYRLIYLHCRVRELYAVKYSKYAAKERSYDIWFSEICNFYKKKFGC